MKKICLLILAGLLVLSGCSLSDLGKVKVINDEIDNSKAVILQVLYRSSDQGMTNYRALVTYSKTLKENEPLMTTVNFKIGTDLTEIALSPKGYLVTDSQKYELTISNISTKTDTYTQTSNINDKDVDTHTYTVYIMEGDLSLSPETTEQMKISTKLTYRLYLGKRPLTFEVANKDLELVKAFIDTN